MGGGRVVRDRERLNEPSLAAWRAAAGGYLLSCFQIRKASKRT